MAQSKRYSLIESTTNTLSGFGLSFALGFVVFPLFGHSFKVIELGWITLFYTLVSMGRNYVVRRYFNWRIYRSLEQVRTGEPGS